MAQKQRIQRIFGPGDAEMRRTKLLLRFLVVVLTLMIILVFPLYHLSAAHHETCEVSSPIFEEELLLQINRYRIDNGLKPLSHHGTSSNLAKSHSRYMCTTDKLSHENFKERFVRSGRTCCVENVGWNYATAVDQLKGWKESPSHNENLLDKRIRVAGVSKVGAYVTFFACE